MVDIVSNFAVPRSAPALRRQADLLAHAYIASLARALGKAQSTDSVNAPLRIFVEESARRSEGGAQLWAPEIGVIRAFFRREDFDGSLAQLALFLTSAGEHAPWAADLDRPRSFLFAGHILHLAGRIEVDSREDQVEIKDEDGSRLFRKTDKSGWVTGADATRVSSVIPTPQAGGFEDAKYVIALRRDPNVVDGEEIDQADLFGTIDEAGRPLADYAATQLRKAFDMVDATLPSFYEYLRILLRGIGAVPAGSGVNGQSSGSSSEYPGIFTCTFPGSADWLAETLVHESSHQYLNLLHSAFPLTLKDDGKRYYSSIKGNTRSLQRQIIGYHAVANIVIFRRALVKVGDNPNRRRELARFEEYAVKMREELEQGTTFTEEGQCFVDALNASLDDTPALVPSAADRSAA